MDQISKNDLALNVKYVQDNVNARHCRYEFPEHSGKTVRQGLAELYRTNSLFFTNGKISEEPVPDHGIIGARRLLHRTSLK